MFRFNEEFRFQYYCTALKVTKENNVSSKALAPKLDFRTAEHYEGVKRISEVFTVRRDRSMFGVHREVTEHLRKDCKRPLLPRSTGNLHILK